MEPLFLIDEQFNRKEKELNKILTYQGIGKHPDKHAVIMKKLIYAAIYHYNKKKKIIDKFDTRFIINKPNVRHLIKSQLMKEDTQQYFTPSKIQKSEENYIQNNNGNQLIRPLSIPDNNLEQPTQEFTKISPVPKPQMPLNPIQKSSNIIKPIGFSNPPRTSEIIWPEYKPIITVPKTVQSQSISVPKSIATSQGSLYHPKVMSAKTNSFSRTSVPQSISRASKINTNITQDKTRPLFSNIKIAPIPVIKQKINSELHKPITQQPEAPFIKKINLNPNVIEEKTPRFDAENNNLDNMNKYTPLQEPTESSNIIDQHISKNPEGMFVYNVKELTLDPKTYRVFYSVQNKLFDIIEKSPNLLDDQDFFNKNLKENLKVLNININAINIDDLRLYLRNYILGFNKIQPLIQDSNIKTIYCSGANQPLIVEHSRYGKIQTNLDFKSNTELDDFIKYISKKAGRSINPSTPNLSIEFPNGIKLLATIGGDFVSSKFILQKP
ncbi:hypothetical protein J4471_04825 [Candidatus Woesearchaeota archaeon]|nr:hypothetical protein [Candidatus Woesearchaeota archaeon]